jgi:hypothetical protein
MPISDLVEEASLFVVVALILALATISLRRDARKSTVNMVFFMLAGLVGLVLVERFGPVLARGRSAASCARARSPSLRSASPASP